MCNFPSKFSAWKDPKRVRANHAKMSNCNIFGSSPMSHKHQYNNILFTTCMCTLYDSNIDTLLALEEQHNKFNTIPDLYTGTNNNYSYLNAPIKLMNCFTVIRSFLTKKEAELRKEEQNKNK